ncbi:MAG: class I SAM-dependent methyltransferase [Sediminibacterium sp.]
MEEEIEKKQGLPLAQKLEMFSNRLTKVFKHRSKIARRTGVGCYRIYEHDLPEFPFCIEAYENKIYVSEYVRRHGMTDEEHDAWLQPSLEIISEITGTPLTSIYKRERKKMSHRDEQYEKVDTKQEFFTVLENDLKFQVNLTDYLDTGLFLDHRITREMVRKEAKDKRFLNLFCYTGSFSVYAAAGEAATVTSVDLSKTYLGWAETNMAINLLKDPNKYFYIHADVKQYLKTLAPDSFDLIVMDPPTFSNSKRMKDFLDIQRDHVELINDMLAATTTGGTLYFSTNYTKFILDEALIKASSIKDITKTTTGFDFEGKLKRWCYRIIK